jgi:hypothetical protein
VALVVQMELVMGNTEPIQSYSASTDTVFVQEVKNLIINVQNQAMQAGFDYTDGNTRYAVAKVYDDWVVVLTIFVDSGDPEQFSASAPSK